jgi:hypothetical protein
MAARVDTITVTTSADPANRRCGDVLRCGRVARRISQLALATDAEISSRHLSSSRPDGWAGDEGQDRALYKGIESEIHTHFRAHARTRLGRSTRTLCEWWGEPILDGEARLPFLRDLPPRPQLGYDAGRGGWAPSRRGVG